MANGNNPQSAASSKKRGHSPVWRTNAKPNYSCSWGDVDPTVIRGAIDAATKGSGAIMFGLTTDGGAYSLCVLQDSDKMKEYPHSVAECEELLRSLIAWYVDREL